MRRLVPLNTEIITSEGMKTSQCIKSMNLYWDRRPFGNTLPLCLWQPDPYSRTWKKHPSNWDKMLSVTTENFITPGKRSTWTPLVYYWKSIWHVTVYHLTCVNKHVAERVSMFNLSLLFCFTYCWKRRMSYVVTMNIDNTDSRFTR